MANILGEFFNKSISDSVEENSNFDFLFYNNSLDLEVGCELTDELEGEEQEDEKEEDDDDDNEKF